MNTNEAVLKSKAIQRANMRYAQEMKKIAYVQFKELAKKNMRLPIELISL
ncbi:hypothetical protein HYS00_04295 [Candidatus Microgenomates bacterium]|nr:hypothetical protein [Candidatus Microgenomates bacterium]